MADYMELLLKKVKGISALHDILQEGLHGITDQRQRRRLGDAFEKGGSNFSAAYVLLESHFARRGTGVKDVSNRAKYVFRREQIEKLVEKVDKSFKELRDIASDIFGQIPAESDMQVFFMLQEVLDHLRRQEEPLVDMNHAVEI
ncbi:hypothetical protein GGR57DRAFT_89930 [Xylariaceae sp. FL1272]|nr:hypothetical protein GGR57DRAFT_89930 [Xylariaceae sp. FL1272]